MQVNHGIQNNLNLFLHPESNNRDVVHMRPVSHQIYRGVNFVGIALQQKANIERWHGRALIKFAKGFMATGYVLNSVIALTESVAAFAFATFALTIHAITKGRSASFQKIAIKTVSYYLNTIAIAVAQIMSLKKGTFLRHHIANVALENVIRGLAALLAQFVGFGFDQWAGRNSNIRLLPSFIRAGRVFIELLPNAMNNASRAIRIDFATHIRYAGNNNHFGNFLRDNPQLAEALNNFTFERLRNAEYRGELLRLTTQYLVQQGILNVNLPMPQAGIGVPNNQDIFYVNNNVNDRNYQNKLREDVKRAYIEIYDNPEFLRLLSHKTNENETLDDGRDNLTTALAAIQLAHYVAFKEIQNEIVCPEQFGSQDLNTVNNRHKLLTDARALFNQLNEAEKNILLRKVLSAKEYDISSQGLEVVRAELVQRTFNLIGQIGGQNHQGRLMSQNYVNNQMMNQGNFNGAFGAVNLFQGACQDAQAEINARV